MTGTFMPAIAGWALGPAIKEKASSLVRKSPLLRSSVAGLSDLRARHPKLLKLAIVCAVLVMRHRRKSKVG